jgi:hypothetical protein
VGLGFLHAEFVPGVSPPEIAATYDDGKLNRCVANSVGKHRGEPLCGAWINAVPAVTDEVLAT